MGDVVKQRHGVTVLECAADGPPVGSESDAADLIGDALGARVDLVAIPVGRLVPEFFTLASGIAGSVVQKFVQYRLRLAVVGDISAQLAASKALRDYIFETNRGNQVWFLDSDAALDARLAGREHTAM